MDLVVTGLSHKTAQLALRERAVFDRDEAIDMLQRLKSDASPQLLLLSTCNRTEIYAVASDVVATGQALRRAVFDERLAGVEDADKSLYTLHGEAAVAHFYRVASGLDSLVVGEQQILGQVKHAFQLSERAQTVGSLLHRLANGAFRVGKRARGETHIGHGAVSVASIGVELAERIFHDFSGKRALLIGAGENGRLCAQHLLARNVASLTVTNRTPEKAEKLAADLGGDTAPFDNLVAAIVAADIVISTTGAKGTVLDARIVREAMRARDQSALIIIDIAVPRDVAPDVDGLPNVFLFDIDALNEIARRNVQLREKEIPKVEKIVDAEVQNFMRWWGSLDAGPVIRDLHAHFEAVRESEVSRNSKRFLEADRGELDAFSRTLVRKLLMGVTQRIKGYRKEDPVELERLAGLRAAFGLQESDLDE
ncbi:MAG: glutamyl-tRNA reductase [Deltaproteobacteria bacterium RIFOXYB12_FULL_58_9]|nr:MAG: glutamyl-tRNA reductase [Deltaproteobacteria bacterium RIFOXYB12_FULL_58_9]